MHSKQMFIVHLLDKKQSQNGIATVSGKCQTSNTCYPVGIKCVHTPSDSQKYDPDSSLKSIQTGNASNAKNSDKSQLDPKYLQPSRNRLGSSASSNNEVVPKSSLGTRKQQSVYFS